MKTDFIKITKGITQIIEVWEPKLTSLDKEVITERRNKQNRNVMQILGHLVDSASNNHQRMVRLQYNKELIFPDYRQDNDLWITIQNYQESNWNNLIQLWKFYNLHIIQIINQVDFLALKNSWTDFEGNKVSLQEMITAYLDHLNLHINEIKELIGSDKPD